MHNSFEDSSLPYGSLSLGGREPGTTTACSESVPDQAAINTVQTGIDLER